MRQIKNYIGLSTGSHDSALAVVDAAGHVTFAEGTERWMQYKRAFHVAPDAPFRIDKVLAMYCESGADIVAAHTWSEHHANSIAEGLAEWTRSVEAPSEVARPGRVRSHAARKYLANVAHAANSVRIALEQRGQELGFELLRARGWVSSNLERRYFDHHLTHAATACFSSPFDRATCAVIDGYGEGRAFACYSYERGVIRELALPVAPRSQTAASLGLFFMDVCDACGFHPDAGEEWKVMGLAGYGQPDARIEGVLRRMIGVDGSGLVSPSLAEMLLLQEQLEVLSRKPGQRALDVAALAHTGQKIFEETLYAFLRELHKAAASDNLVLGGGCALNSSANGKILTNTPFKQLHVSSAPADDGNAIGAALLAHQQDNPGQRAPAQILSPYLGSSMSTDTLANVKRFSGLPHVTECAGRAPERAAELLAAGRIVGWIRGRAEFGPRALGNRSILADPRSAAVKDRLNERVKFREEFRPFAPSILPEYGPEYFEDYQPSPYMERTLKFREDVRRLVPGAVHVDGTGRLQTVSKDWNPDFHRLLVHFHECTGIPLVINTSYNVMGKPIVHSVEDALAVFFTSGLDALFIEDLLVLKE